MWWMVSFTPQPFFPLEKSPQYPLNRRLNGLQSQTGYFKKRKIFTGNWNAFPPCPACSLVTILTQLSCLRLPSSVFRYATTASFKKKKTSLLLVQKHPPVCPMFYNLNSRKTSLNNIKLCHFTPHNLFNYEGGAIKPRIYETDRKQVYD